MHAFDTASSQLAQAVCIVCIYSVGTQICMHMYTTLTFMKAAAPPQAVQESCSPVMMLMLMLMQLASATVTL